MRYRKFTVVQASTATGVHGRASSHRLAHGQEEGRCFSFLFSLPEKSSVSSMIVQKFMEVQFALSLITQFIGDWSPPHPRAAGIGFGGAVKEN